MARSAYPDAIPFHAAPGEPLGVRVDTARPAHRLALLVLQVGALAVVLAAATYRSFELDRFFVPKEAVLHAVALIVAVLSIGAARAARLSRADLFLAGFLALGAASAALATNPWLGARSLAVGASGVALFWGARSLARAGLARPLVAALAAAVALGAATSLAQAYGLKLDVFSVNRAPGGTLGNRNFVAHLCAFGLPVILLAGVWARSWGGVVPAGVGMAAVTATLVLTRSRAAWLAAVAAMAVLLVGFLLSPPVRRQVRSWARLLLLLGFSLGGGALAILLPNALRWKSDTPYAETAARLVDYQGGSGRGRLIQYRNSAEMALAHPLLGVGPGNWAVTYPAFAARRDPSMDQSEPGTTSNPWPSSDWVAFLSERGLPAFALLVAAFAALGLGALGRARRARDADQGLAAVAMGATLAGAVVAGAFDAVLLLALPSLLVWAALGALSADDPGRWTVPVGAPVRILGAVAAIVVLGAFTLRSGAQTVAMGLYETGRVPNLQRAASLDPGGYRIRLRLARTLGGRANRAERCEHARAARDLFPEAAAAKAAARGCPERSEGE